MKNENESVNSGSRELRWISESWINQTTPSVVSDNTKLSLSFGNWLSSTYNLDVLWYTTDVSII
jgi:hypothetical protein